MLGRIPIKENINNARKILCVSRVFGEILLEAETSASFYYRKNEKGDNYEQKD